MDLTPQQSDELKRLTFELNRMKSLLIEKASDINATKELNEKIKITTEQIENLHRGNSSNKNIIKVDLSKSRMHPIERSFSQIFSH